MRNANCESLGLLVEIIEPVTIGARIGLLVIGAPPCPLTSTRLSSARAADGSTSGRSCRRSAGNLLTHANSIARLMAARMLGGHGLVVLGPLRFHACCTGYPGVDAA
jgi:hypothetical protein